jgi:K+-transporting ATPase ATPase C chain
MKEIRPAIILLLAFTILCGIVYPALVTGLARATGAEPATHLIGQTFTGPDYFWGRPSAVSYDAKTSMGTNLGPTHITTKNKETGMSVLDNNIAALREVDPDNPLPIPVDLVTASGSGLDPHISPAAARYQVARVARARGLAEADVHKLVDRHVEGRTFALLGDPRVNVVALNRALDQLAKR